MHTGTDTCVIENGIARAGKWDRLKSAETSSKTLAGIAEADHSSRMDLLLGASVVSSEKCESPDWPFNCKDHQPTQHSVTTQLTCVSKIQTRSMSTASTGHCQELRGGVMNRFLDAVILCHWF